MAEPVLITPAVTLPVDLAACKALCGIESNSFDTQLELLRKAAHRSIGEFLGLALGQSTWRLELDQFSDTIELSRGPGVTVAAADFTYLDTNGVRQQVDPGSYYLDLVRVPGWIVRAEEASWPDVLSAPSVVRVDFTAGWTSATIPDEVTLAVGALVKHWWEKGADAGVPGSVRDMVHHFRRIRI